MQVNYTVSSVDAEAGFVVVHVEYEGGITGDYRIGVEAFSTSVDDTEQMMKLALDSVIKKIAREAFPPAPLEPPALLKLQGWSNEFVQP